MWGIINVVILSTNTLVDKTAVKSNIFLSRQKWNKLVCFSYIFSGKLKNFELDRSLPKWSSATTLNVTTLSIKGLHATHQQRSTIMLVSLCRVTCFIYYNAKCHYAECRYAECIYAECRGAIQLNSKAPEFLFTKLNNDFF